jgi:hypothetical protein
MPSTLTSESPKAGSGNATDKHKSRTKNVLDINIPPWLIVYLSTAIIQVKSVKLDAQCYNKYNNY